MASVITRFLSALRLARFKAMSGSNLSVGSGFVCGPFSHISRTRKIKLGKRFFMGSQCHLSAPLDIGDDVMFASYVSVVGGDHKIDEITGPIRESGRDEMRQVKIDEDVWVGHGVILLHGIHIASGAVVAAGSVVTKDVPARAIVAGNPARALRYRR
jgi:maltose O-acetyltransferase